MTTTRIIDVEGLDGVGKSTALEAVTKHVRTRPGRSWEDVFNVVHFEKEHHRLPTLDEIGSVAMIVVAEPTYSPPTGTAIRNPGGLLDRKTVMSVAEEARLYAEDRARLYHEVVLPYLATHETGWVAKSRGLTSSLAYQGPRFYGLERLEEAVEEILLHAGNQLELTHAPQHLIILDLDPQLALLRMSNRGLDRFEADLSLQIQVRQMYLDQRIQAPFRSRGTQVDVIDALIGESEIHAAINLLLRDRF